jgi:hypothetical protein
MDTVKGFIKYMLIFTGMCLLIAGAQAGEPSSNEGFSDSHPMQRPVLGFVYDDDVSELRAIFGIAGASVFSDPLEVPIEDAGIYFAPGQEYAIVEQGTEAPIGVIGLNKENWGSIIEIPDAVSKPDIVTFSPNGLSAAVYSSVEGRLQIVRGFPGAPRLDWEVLESDLLDEVRFLGLADDGSTLLEGSVHSVVYLLAKDGSARFVYEAKDLGAMAFAPGSRNALVYDRGEGSASLLMNVLGSATQVPLISGLTNVNGDITLWIDSDKAIIANTNPSEIWQIDRKSLQVENLPLTATPNVLQPLRAAGKLLFSYEPGKPAWVLDVSRKTPAAYFVPAHGITDKRSITGRTPVKQRGRIRQPLRNSHVTR